MHAISSLAASLTLFTSPGHLIAWEKAHATVLKLKSQYEDACRLADQAEDEYNFSRSAPAPSHTPASPLSAPTPLALPPIKEDKGKGKELPRPPPPVQEQRKPLDDDDRSLDGIDDDDDDAVIPRSGLVGGAGSITSALGRAMTTIRRKPIAPATVEGDSQQTSNAQAGFTADPAVGKAVDWGKTT